MGQGVQHTWFITLKLFYDRATIAVTIDDGVITHTDTEVFYSILNFTVYWVREIMVLKLNVSRMGQISPTKQLSRELSINFIE